MLFYMLLHTAMQKYFASAGLSSDQQIITYCGGGGCAALDAFVLLLMGYENVSLYYNSLNEWGADSILPMSRS